MLHSPQSVGSSEPSPQSLSWSQKKLLGTHCLFRHMNWLLSHVLLNAETQEVVVGSEHYYTIRAETQEVVVGSEHYYTIRDTGSSCWVRTLLHNKTETQEVVVGSEHYYTKD